jgi:hypothetical protein
MRSVPLAISWDVWLHGRRWIVYGFVGVLAVMAFIYLSLRRTGHWTPLLEDTLHFVILGIQTLVFVSALVNATGSARRYYTRPLPASHIALTLLLPGMLAVVMMHLAVTVGFNAATGADWPIAGPLLFSVAAVAVVTAVYWATAGLDLLRVLIIAGVGYGILQWLTQRTENPTHALPGTWRVLTRSEILTLITAIAIAYVVSVASIWLDRSSRLPWARLPSLQQLWLLVANRRTEMLPTFATAKHAHRWREWREKGLIGPAILTAYFAGLVIAAVGDWISEESFKTAVFTAGNWLILLFAVLGAGFGKCGGTVRQPACGSFLATRPLTDAALSYGMLACAFRSILTTWLCWVAVASAVGILLLTPEPINPPDSTIYDMVTKPAPVLGWWASLIWAALILLAMWTAVGFVTPLFMAGRSWLVALVYTTAIVGLVTYGYVTDWLAKHSLNDMIWWIHAALVATAILLTLLTLVAARWKRLLGPREFSLAAGVWLAAFVVLELALHLQGGLTWNWYWGDFLLPFFAVLPTFSLAAAPLAISWNRHR